MLSSRDSRATEYWRFVEEVLDFTGYWDSRRRRKRHLGRRRGEAPQNPKDLIKPIVVKVYVAGRRGLRYKDLREAFVRPRRGNPPLDKTDYLFDHEIQLERRLEDLVRIQVLEKRGSRRKRTYRSNPRDFKVVSRTPDVVGAAYPSHLTFGILEFDPSQLPVEDQIAIYCPTPDDIVDYLGQSEDINRFIMDACRNLYIAKVLLEKRGARPAARLIERERSRHWDDDR